MSSCAHRHNHRCSSTPHDRRLAARITKEFTTALPKIVAQLQNINSSGSATSATLKNYHYKNFTSAKPPSYLGEENATKLLRWFEQMENKFIHYECPEDKRTRFASSVFEERALTWWNSYKDLHSVEEVLAMTWEELKDAMKREFCPEHELQKLETEFWELKQIGGDNSTYSNRFKELSLLVPHLVTPLARGIRKYIRGLPTIFRDVVVSRDL
ncbi:uncharacterized protein LOC143636667 [Bidens hawaiensis]|uniref:uncharacterized protein LOC143636667 n=1 Tax=Bidens hawaiensis TaxID=980011 RepID=UPI00404B3528